MTVFRIMQATQRPVEGHLVGVLNASPDDGGRAFLGVRVGDALDQFTLTTGETHRLPDGWTLRLIDVTPPKTEHDKTTLGVELLAPADGASA
jgi:hypothetical protein